MRSFHLCKDGSLLWYTNRMDFSTLLIDLDDTVYPADSGVWQAISERIELFVEQKYRLSRPEAMELRQSLFLRYGTTMRGLQAEYHLDEDEYLAFVHAVPLADFIHPDPGLCQVLSRYRQRRVIFTNADTPHAHRVLGVLGIAECIDQIVDVKAMAPYCKPMPEAFRIAMERVGECDPGRIVLVDDQAHNLRAAHALGMYTVQVGRRANGEADASVAKLADLPHVLSWE